MTHKNEINVEIAQFITQNFLNGDGEGIEYTSPLLEWGILDSLKVLSLISFAEDKFSVDIDADRLTPSNLSSIDSFSSLILERIQQVDSKII